MSLAESLELKAALESEGEAELRVCTLGRWVIIKKNMVSVNMEKKMEHQRIFTPSIIEPSLDIGQIIYCLFEHSFYTRPSNLKGGRLNVFRFSLLVAPFKCTIFPQTDCQQLAKVAKFIMKSLRSNGISDIPVIKDTLVELRYAKIDEIGVPFSITVDSTSTVMIRERDSEEQIRVRIDKVTSVMKEVLDGQSTWADLRWRFRTHSASHVK